MAETSASPSPVDSEYGPADTDLQGADPGSPYRRLPRGAASDDAYLFAVRPDGATGAS